MLRRKPDNTFEFRDIEQALYRAAPASLSPERREALRVRIFSELGAQESPRRTPASIAGERWIAIPVGASIAAAVIAATQYLDDQRGPAGETTWVATASGSVTIDGVAAATADPGERIEADGPSWVAVGRKVRVGLGSGSAFRFASSDDRLALLLESGTHHIVSDEALLEVRGGRWVARMTGPGAIEVSIREWHTSLVSIEGETVVQYAGSSYLLRPGDRPLLLLSQPPDDPGSGLRGGDSGTGPANGGGSPDPGPAPVAGPDDEPGNHPAAPAPGEDDTPAGPPASPPAPASTGDVDATGDEGSASQVPGTPPGPPESVPPPAGDPPPVDPPAPGPPPGDPPANPPGGPPADPPPASPPQDPGNGNGNGSPPPDPGAGSGNSGNGLGNSGEHPHGGPPGQAPESNGAGKSSPGSSLTLGEAPGDAPAEQAATAPSEPDAGGVTSAPGNRAASKAKGEPAAKGGPGGAGGTPAGPALEHSPGGNGRSK